MRSSVLFVVMFEGELLVKVLPDCGRGRYWRSFCATELMYCAGMMLPTNGCPVYGFISCVSGRSDEKSPPRIASVSVVPFRVRLLIWRKPSYDAVKNVLLRPS